MKEKTFYKILIEFTHSIEKTKRGLSDRRLTKTEKLIIEGHLHIRKNQNQEVLNLFLDSTPSELAFVESQRLLLIGSALNNLSRLLEAKKYIIDSIKILETIEAPFFLFYSYHLLFTIHSNLHATDMMAHTIKAMETLHKTKRQEAQFLMCQFCYEQLVGNIEKAKIHLTEINKHLKDMSEGDTVRHLVDTFSFYVMLGELQEADKVLSKLKSYRNYQLSENYNFMRKMLDHLISDAPLYIYDHQFQEIPILLHQLKVIQSLEEKNTTQASFHWEKLKTYAPDTYGKAFEYHGAVCLFSLGLKKHLDHSDSKLEVLGETKLDKLYSILQSAKAPIPAAMIHELLWEAEPVEKEDLKKVSRLISRLKSEKNISIEYRKGAYFLSHQKVSKAS
jgi:hypothetical protein